MIEAFPLQWPVGYKRTVYPTKSRFDTSFAVARDELLKEIKRLAGRSPIISTNIPLRLDGLPYASFSKITDKGVAVYFTLNLEQMVFACDKWDKVEDNMQAIRKAINAIRSLDAWGVSEMMKRAFTGFKAITEQIDKRPWWEVLGVNSRASRDEIKKAYYAKAQVLHPDKPTGSTAAFQHLQEAYDFAITT